MIATTFWARSPRVTRHPPHASRRLHTNVSTIAVAHPLMRPCLRYDQGYLEALGSSIPASARDMLKLTLLFHGPTLRYNIPTSPQTHKYPAGHFYHSPVRCRSVRDQATSTPQSLTFYRRVLDEWQPKAVGVEIFNCPSDLGPKSRTSGPHPKGCRLKLVLRPELVQAPVRCSKSRCCA